MANTKDISYIGELFEETEATDLDRIRAMSLLSAEMESWKN